MHDAVMRDGVQMKHLTSRYSGKSFGLFIQDSCLEENQNGFRLGCLMMNLTLTAQQRTEVSTCGS